MPQGPVSTCGKGHNLKHLARPGEHLSSDSFMIQGLMTHASRKLARYLRSKPFKMQNHTPLVTFTFDGCPDSAFLNGTPILEDHGIYGTFYIAAGVADTDEIYWHLITPEQVRALHDRGHEIGSHTYSKVRVENLSASRLDEELRMNHNLLRRLCGDIQLTNFSYPFGSVSLQRKIQLLQKFETCRGINEGVNVGTVDLGLLKAVELYNRTLTTNKLQRLLRETCDRNGWLIFYGHDVSDPPSISGCSPDFLRATIKTIQAMGLACVSIRDGLKSIGYSGG
jgi:peptidoglycan/xylan/chitin deacetylase (PgdA/CDA1 family)